MKSCSTCGRPPETSCEPCLTGNPPAERVADLEVERAAREAEAQEKRRRKMLDEAQVQLRAIPDLYVFLPEFLIPGSGRSEQGGSSSPARPPLTLGTVDLLDTREKPAAEDETVAAGQGVLPTLTSWVRVIDETLDRTPGYKAPWRRVACCASCAIEYADGSSDQVGCCVGSYRPHPWAQRTVSGECAFLLTHLEWTSKQQWFDELAYDIRKQYRQMRSTTHETDELALPCLDCGWQMQGMGDYDKTRGRFPWYRCTGCGRSVTTQSELDRVERKAQDTVTLRYAAEQLGRPFATLREWKRQGWITPVGKDSRGSVYSLAAIAKAAKLVRKPGRPAEKTSTSA